MKVTVTKADNTLFINVVMNYFQVVIIPMPFGEEILNVGLNMATLIN